MSSPHGTGRAAGGFKLSEPLMENTCHAKSEGYTRNRERKVVGEKSMSNV
jgi:hypothetical protein